MSGYVSWPSAIPRNTDEGYVALIDAWKANSAKIINRINNFIEHSINTQMAKYEITNVIHAIKFCKIVSIREWHTSSSPEK